MRFDYIRFTEEWASLYKPMLHSLDSDHNRRFFITDSYMTMVDFMAHMDPETTPCVVVESQQEGSISEGWDNPRYAYYFMVRADEMNAGKEAVEAKRSAKEIMLDFVNFVRMFRSAGQQDSDAVASLSHFHLPEGSYLDQLRTAILDLGDRCMENLNVDTFTYESLNQMQDGWYGIQFSLEDTSLVCLCPDRSMYAEAGKEGEDE